MLKQLGPASWGGFKRSRTFSQSKQSCVNNGRGPTQTPCFLFFCNQRHKRRPWKHRESVRGLVSGHLGNTKVYKEARTVMPRSLAPMVWGGGGTGASCLVIGTQMGCYGCYFLTMKPKPVLVTKSWLHAGCEVVCARNRGSTRVVHMPLEPALKTCVLACANVSKPHGCFPATKYLRHGASYLVIRAQMGASWL